MENFKKPTIEELVAALEALPDECFTDPCDDGMKYAKHSDDRVCDIDGMACSLLISSGGRCNWANIRDLRGHGFDVYAGDKDSFGWLTGCIEFPDMERVLVYG